LKICVIGTGYVGLVTGACLANLGNEVFCVDKEKSRVHGLIKGQVPFFEAGLESLVLQNFKAKRLFFSTDLVSSVERSDVVLIAVGTPSKESGQPDISAVIEVTGEIARALKKRTKKRRSNQKYKVIVNKSTVPVGMGDIVTKILLEKNVPKKMFAVVSNPEFLREGSAIADFLHPDRIVIGASDSRAFNVIGELYRPLNAHIIFTSIKSAELIKYASNAFLAAKISFINEIANICERVGADVKEVASAMGLDKRIGREFLNAGIGYGGSCFPKDLSALIHLARENGYNPKILNSVIDINEFQIEAFVKKILNLLEKADNAQITLLGLSFKPGTDDLRAAPALKIVEKLIEKGIKINVYDPCLRKNTTQMRIEIFNDVYLALKGSDAMVLVTEWPEFQGLDFDRVKNALKRPIIIDGRNAYDPKKIKELGFMYLGVGR